MPRFYGLMITILILVAIAFLLGWFQVSTTSDQKRDKVNFELTLDKSKVKDDAAAAAAKAQELGQKTKEEAKDVARKIGNLAGGDRPAWSVDRKSIELTSGQSADVLLTRTGADLKSMQAGVFPSAGSNLLVSGGLFKEGEKTAHITIEAASDSRDGSVTIVADGKSEVVAVTVKPAPGGKPL